MSSATSNRQPILFQRNGDWWLMDEGEYQVCTKGSALAKALEAIARSSTSQPDPLAQWKSRPSADEIEAHYPSSQHQPDECEMCRFIHDAAKAYLGARSSTAQPLPPKGENKAGELDQVYRDLMDGELVLVRCR